MMTFMRTIIDLPAGDVDALDALCRREGISRAEAIRRAVAQHLLANRAGDPNQAFGLWRARPVDGLRHQRRLRREWDADK
jgi:metal-responsive CopG/Arc/MetJ family transcriptional regulator